MPPDANDIIPFWNDFSLYTNKTIKDAITYAYDHYLGTAYTGKIESAPANIGGKKVYRQVHGLAHTLRTMAFAEVIVEEARKAKLRGEPLAAAKDGRTLADVTPDELKKIMIAQAFFVAGRQDEASDYDHYVAYHKLSRKAFLEYIHLNEAALIPSVFKNQQEVLFYADIVEDKEGQWNDTPAHLLVNKAHMVDLLRVKQPPESYFEHYFQALKPWVSSRGAEAVFAMQRQFFHATYEAVAGFDADNQEPHLVVGQLGRYVIGADGKPIKDGPLQGNLKVFNHAYKLKANEHFMSVAEYLNLEKIKRNFPGCGKKLEGGMPGLNELNYLKRLSSKERALCETDVNFCFNQLEKVHHEAPINLIQSAVQASNIPKRRAANEDEHAAAGIIALILANPESIQENHVLLNNQKLEEAFFRELLAKCDMAIVGSLLKNEDILNIDKLMKHEINTLFHETGQGVIASEAIGKKWASTYRIRNKKKTEIFSIEMSLIDMMQDGSWYYRRVNAIAQGRDTGSSFKEVLISALMIPATYKAMTHVQPLIYPKKILKESPKILYKGFMGLPPALTKKIMDQSIAIIKNETLGLFSDTSAQLKQQMQINQLTSMLAKICSSTSAKSDAALFFAQGADNVNNIRLDIEDAKGLIDAQRIGRHGPAAENEYSVYLPDDVALIPIEVKKGNPHIIRVVAVKSPDFLPQHQSGFAAEPFKKIQKLAAEAPKIKQDKQEIKLQKKLENIIKELTRQSKLPVRTNIFHRLSHFFSLEKSDQKISQERKNFLKKRVIPALNSCLNALNEKNVYLMKKALDKLPQDKGWSVFKSAEAKQAKVKIDDLKQQILDFVDQQAVAGFQP